MCNEYLRSLQRELAAVYHKAKQHFGLQQQTPFYRADGRDLHIPPMALVILPESEPTL